MEKNMSAQIFLLHTAMCVAKCKKPTERVDSPCYSNSMFYLKKVHFNTFTYWLSKTKKNIQHFLKKDNI